MQKLVPVSLVLCDQVRASGIGTPHNLEVVYQEGMLVKGRW